MYKIQAYVDFQKEIVRLANNGVVVVLASKNNDRDVWDVFDLHGAMELKRDHIVASKINWNEKSNNIRQLSKDLSLGGQGAPIAPIYHKFIIETLGIELPSCFLNIGGVSNLTFWDGRSLIGFDTGPGNALMDDFMSSKLNKKYDKDGNLGASIGRKSFPENKILLVDF
mgnify:CR=1 FL=1